MRDNLTSLEKKRKEFHGRKVNSGKDQDFCVIKNVDFFFFFEAWVLRKRTEENKVNSRKKEREFLQRKRFSKTICRGL